MNRDELDGVLRLVSEQAAAYLARLDDAPLHAPGYEEAAWSFDGPLPEDGIGAAATLHRLLEEGLPGTVASSGPRSFHFVTGGVTPAALAADWLASTLDQNSFAWIES